MNLWVDLIVEEFLVRYLGLGRDVDLCEHSSDLVFVLLLRELVLRRLLLNLIEVEGILLSFHKLDLVLLSLGNCCRVQALLGQFQ